MDYDPLPAPQSDHHQLNTGLSTELGASAKQLIEHINAHFKNLYQVVRGEVAHVVETIDDEARKAVLDLSEHVTALEKKNEALQETIAKLHADIAAFGAPAAQGVVGEPKLGNPNVEQPANASLDDAIKKATGQ